MFYDNYVRECRRKGLTPSRVALNCGFSKTSVTRWKNGATPNGDIVATLAKYLGVSSDRLLGSVLGAGGEATDGVLISIVGEIAAGNPIVADEDVEGYVLSDVGNPQSFFYLRVRGDSMQNAGIRNGALVLIKRQSIALNNQIVACLVGGDSATLKRFYKTDTTITLMPENPLYSPITLPISAFENGEAMIIGIAVRVMTDL